MDKEREYTIEDITYGFFTENEGGLTLNEIKTEEKIADYLIKKLIKDPAYINFLFKGYRNNLLEILVNDKQLTYNFVKDLMDGLSDKIANEKAAPSGELQEAEVDSRDEALDGEVEELNDKEINLEKIFEDEDILDYLIEKIFKDEEYVDFLRDEFDDLFMEHLIENEITAFDFMSDVFYELHSKEVEESAAEED